MTSSDFFLVKDLLQVGFCLDTVEMNAFIIDLHHFCCQLHDLFVNNFR